MGQARIQIFKKSLFGGGLFLSSWICIVNLDLSLLLDSSLSLRANLNKTDAKDGVYLASYEPPLTRKTRFKMLLILYRQIWNSITSIAISYYVFLFFPDIYEAIGLEEKWKYVLLIILLIPQLSPFAKLLGKHYGGIFL